MGAVVVAYEPSDSPSPFSGPMTVRTGCSGTGLYPIGEISPKGYSHHASVAIDICTRLGRRIRRLRQQRGWTQTYLAEHTGLGRAFISNLENGRKEACLRSMEILAIGFDVSLSQLFRDL